MAVSHTYTSPRGIPGYNWDDLPEALQEYTPGRKRKNAAPSKAKESPKKVTPKAKATPKKEKATPVKATPSKDSKASGKKGTPKKGSPKAAQARLQKRAASPSESASSSSSQEPAAAKDETSPAKAESKGMDDLLFWIETVMNFLIGWLVVAILCAAPYYMWQYFQKNLK
eukprot:64014_1